MNTQNNTNLKLAIQKDGRLTQDTLLFLRRAGFEFESYNQRLFSVSRNFPLEIYFVRVNDIPDYVTTGAVDIGIVGQNALYEMRPKVNTLLNLNFGFCKLQVAVPKESKIQKISELANSVIATSYPNSVKNFFKKNNVAIDTITIQGSVEIGPSIGVASSIADLVSTGSTLALNDLRPISTIYQSEAVLIANKNLEENKLDLLEKVVTRFKGVLSADSYKYIVMNAPKKIIPQIKKIIPGLKSPTIADLGNDEWVSIASVVKEDIFWETIERLKQEGAQGIVVLPIEKMIL